MSDMRPKTVNKQGVIRMICKWCGASVAVTDAKCARCKRELPALSDCGGFYDLVPKAKREPPVIQTQSPQTVQHEESALKQAPMPQNTARRMAQDKTEKQLRILWTTICFGFVAMLILVTVLTIGLGKKIQAQPDACGHSEEIEYIKNALSPKTEESTAPQSLAEQDIKILVEIANGEKKTIVTTVDLGKCTAMTSTSSNLGAQELEALIGIENASVQVSIQYSVEGEETVLIADIKTEGELLGSVTETGSTYQWEWQLSPAEEWSTIAEDAVTVEGKKLSFNTEILKKWCEDNSATPIVRLQFAQENTDGGSINVEISGIELLNYIQDKT